MSDQLTKCNVCGGLLDEEDLFCPECGTEAPSHAPSPSAGEGGVRGIAKPRAALATHNFTCRGCGASMSYDASAGTLRCPFCGSEQLEQQPDAKEISPAGVVPFVITRDEATTAMRSWLAKGVWRPGDLAEAALVVAMTPVYVPYWVFTAETHTFWTADTSHTPAGARASWYPLSGEHAGHYEGLLVGASSALTPGETSAIAPFDLSSAVAPQKIDLQNITFERFTVPRKYARPQARQGLESLEAQACQQYVPGKSRNVKVNVKVQNLASRPMLVPIWIMAYRYREQVFRFLANGQTGKATGKAPLSYRKISAALLVAIAVIVLMMLLMLKVARGDERASIIPKPGEGGTIAIHCHKSPPRLPWVERRVDIASTRGSYPGKAGGEAFL